MELSAIITNLNINFSFIISIQKKTIGVIIWADFTVRIAFCSCFWWTLLAWPNKCLIISFEQNKSIASSSGHFVLRLSQVFVLQKNHSKFHRWSAHLLFLSDHNKKGANMNNRTMEYDYHKDTKHLYHAFVYSPVSIHYLQCILCLLHRFFTYLKAKFKIGI